MGGLLQERPKKQQWDKVENRGTDFVPLCDVCHLEAMLSHEYNFTCSWSD